MALCSGLMSTAFLQNQLTIIWGDALPCVVWRGHLASRNAGAAEPLTKRSSFLSSSEKISNKKTTKRLTTLNYTQNISLCQWKMHPVGEL
jgi:hypothetical protein